jgi:hypothetical protein
VARSSSSSGGGGGLAQLFNSIRSNGNQANAQSSFVQSATESALLQLQEAGMLTVYDYSKGPCIRLQDGAVRFLGKQGQQQLASRRIFGDAHRPPDEVQKQQRLLLAAFLTYFGKTAVAAMAGKALADGLPYPSGKACQGISNLCLNEAGKTVQALATQIGSSELKAEYVIAAVAESHGVYNRGCVRQDAAWDDYSTALKIIGRQNAPPLLLARMGDVKRCKATWAANSAERDQFLTEAAELLHEAYQGNPDEPLTIMCLAEVRRLQGQFDAAKQLLQDGASAGLVSKLHAFAYKILGAVLLELGQYSEAEDALLQSLNGYAYGKDADVLALLASAKVQQQDRAKALQYAQAADKLLKLPAAKQPRPFWPETEQRVRSLLTALAAAA